MTGRERYYLVCFLIPINSILHTVRHFLIQIAISQEFPLESIIIILTASCLHVTYNVVVYMFVLTIFQHISGVVLILYKKSQQSLPIKALFYYNYGNVPQNGCQYYTKEEREGFDKKVRSLNESQY